MMNVHIKALCEKFSRGVQVDYVGFWEIVSAASLLANENSNLNECDIVISVVQCLLSNGVVPFSFRGNSAKPEIWLYENLEEAVDLITSRWMDLPSKAGLGDVCWFMKAR